MMSSEFILEFFTLKIEYVWTPDSLKD